LTLIYHCNFELISIQRTRFYSLFFFFGYKLKTHLKDTTGTQHSTLLTEERGGSIRERERERERERAEAIFTPQHYDEHNDNIIVIIILQSGRVVANQFGLDWVGNCRGIWGLDWVLAGPGLQAATSEEVWTAGAAHD
jgi:hypothetical protein